MTRLRRLIPFAAGLGLGLYLARVVAEATRIAWSLPALLALVLTTAAAGLGLASPHSHPHIAHLFAGLAVAPPKLSVDRHAQFADGGPGSQLWAPVTSSSSPSSTARCR